MSTAAGGGQKNMLVPEDIMLRTTLANQLDMNWIHAPAGIPRGIKPVQRQWWLDFEEPIGLHDPGDTGVAFLMPLSLTSHKDRSALARCPWRPRLPSLQPSQSAAMSSGSCNAHVDPTQQSMASWSRWK
jgi:hypothetical protein